MISFPSIDPVAVRIPEIMGFGPFPIHWYGIAYIAGFFCGLAYFKFLLRRRNQPVAAPNITEKHADDMFVWVVLGIILGGRLGYVFFYNPTYYLANPHDMLAIWQGGMSYHGGMLGVFLAVLLFAWRHKLNFFDVTDRVAPATCFGLFFGRLANFINGELWGRVTSQPWGVVFPHAGDLPRHPSQLYEAALEGVVLFLLLHFVAKKGIQRYQLSGLFLLGYGVFRSIVELFRQPDNIAHLQHGIFQWITMGQLLSLPMIVGGIMLLQMSEKRARKLRDMEL